MDWSDKIGHPVIFTGTRPPVILDEGTTGILESVHFDPVNGDWANIVYPQNRSYEEDGNGGWRPIKGKPVRTYSHSASLKDIQLA